MSVDLPWEYAADDWGDDEPRDNHATRRLRRYRRNRPMLDGRKVHPDRVRDYRAAFPDEEVSMSTENTPESWIEALEDEADRATGNIEDPIAHPSAADLYRAAAMLLGGIVAALRERDEPAAEEPETCPDCGDDLPHDPPFACGI